VRLLSGEGVQRLLGVVDRSGPDVLRAYAVALVDEVVVGCGRSRRSVVDADVALPPVAGVRVVGRAGGRVRRDRSRIDDRTRGVVDRDVVLDDIVPARTLDVYPVRAVEVDGVADDPAADGVEVVDAVVAVVVRDVVRDERVVRARVDVDAAVLVGIGDVADDRVSRRDVVDAVGVPLVLVRVVVGGVALDQDAGRRSEQVDAVSGVVVGDIVLNDSAGPLLREIPAAGAVTGAPANDTVLPEIVTLLPPVTLIPAKEVPVIVNPEMVTLLRPEIANAPDPPLIVTPGLAVNVTPELAGLTAVAA
jgi:hypothetical protein